MEKDTLIAQIIALEWPMFTSVHHTSGRALCQDDEKTFLIMRTSQFMAWDEATLQSYLHDLQQAADADENLMTFKYGYMMETTHPAEYEIIKEELPSISMKKRQLVMAILRQQIRWITETAAAYPNIIRHGRPIRESQAQQGETAFETYTRCELMTYSEKTITSLWQHIQRLKAQGRNMNEEVLQHTAALYGLKTIAAL